jgi:hypothetical protein
MRLRLVRNLECLVLALALGSVLAGCAAADILAAVSCSTPTAAFQTNGSSCDAMGSYGYSKAAVSSSVELAATASGAAIIEATSTASLMQGGTHGITGTATGQSSADIGIIFDTTGAVRNGLLELSFAQSSWTAPLNGYISENLTIGTYTVAPDGSKLSAIWIPIELGSAFGFDYVQSLAAIGSSGSGVTSGTIGTALSLRAFEADGTTGVQLFDPPESPTPLLLATPEPGNLGIITAGVVGLAFLFRLRR